MAKRVHWHNDSFKKKANEISIDPIDGIESPNTQGALEELAAREGGGGIKYFEYDVIGDVSEEYYESLFPVEPGQIKKVSIPGEIIPSDLTSVSQIIGVSIEASNQHSQALFARAVDGLHFGATIALTIQNVTNEDLWEGEGLNKYLIFKIYYI